MTSSVPSPGAPTPPDGGRCEFCPDGHENPLRRPWAVYVHPTKRDPDGQPVSLVVGKTGCQHVAESDAEWLRQLIREAQGVPR